MTEQPELNQIKTDLQQTLTELTDKIEVMRDELLEAILDSQKEVTALIAQVSAHQKNVLEPNQKTIYHDGIGKIVSILEDLTTNDQKKAEP